MSGYRNDDELKRLSHDVYWRLRQVLVLSTFLDGLRRNGQQRMHDPFDAAALEAFAINARALLDFIWRTRTPDAWPRARPDDVFAVDWFDDGDWKPSEPPPHLASLKKKVGKDIAHITLGADAPSGWQPRYETSGLASALAYFAKRVPASRVGLNFKSAVPDAVAEWRIEIGADDEVFGLIAADPLLPAATPANPTMRELRDSSETTHPDVEALRDRKVANDPCL